MRSLCTAFKAWNKSLGPGRHISCCIRPHYSALRFLAQPAAKDLGRVCISGWGWGLSCC
jgi:hypothetical protein